jgi:TolB-like protein
VSLFAELRRRNVIRMAGLYLVGAWLVVQVSATLLPVFAAPGWVMRVLVGLLAIGFVAALVFSWVFEMTPAGLKRDSEVAPGESIAPQTARRMDRMLFVVMAVALGYFAIDKFVLAPARVVDGASQSTPAGAPTPARTDAAASAQAPASSRQSDAKSIAVLAFANMSADPDNEYFSDGVAEEILNALAKVDELKVAGRTSSFYFKGRNEPLATIGSTLGVAHVLEGSVRKQGERLRISAKLLRVSDGVELWTESFDGTDGDIFALQERIARQVVGELQVALSAGQGSLLVEVGTANPEAYALHLRATEVFNRRAFERYADAIGDARRALELDPGFARAHSRLATLYYLSAVTSQPDAVDGLLERASRAAESALALNPALAEPRAVVAVIAQNRREFGAAREAYSEALRRDADDPTANLWDALSHCYLGYIAQCEQRLDRTLAIDPLLPNALGWRSRLYVSAGDVPAAERTVKLAREVGLRWTGVSGAWIALARGDVEAARLATADTNAVFGAGLPPEAADAFAGASVGDPKAITESLRIIDAHLAARPARINALVPLTLVRMGDIERGLEVFASHPTSNDPLFLGAVMGTRLVPTVWASPAFPEFLRKTGIAAYWDEFGAPEHCRKLSNGDYRCE